MKTLRLTAVGLALTIGLGCAGLPAVADDIAPPDGSTPVVGMAYVSDTTLWLAGPRANRGVVVNALDGREVSFGGTPTSVQALAWHGDRLWIGDIGDPSASRAHVVVFRLGSVAESRSSYHAFDFAYDDGPHDAKAMMISGRGRIFVVTTGTNPGVYRSELDPSRTSMNTLTRVADAPAGVTDGVFLADGTTMALRTGDGIQLFDAVNYEATVTETLVGAPEAESITADPDDNLFVGGNPEIRTVSVPSANATTTVAAPTPSASPSPDASPSATASSSASADPLVDNPGGPARTGTLIALILAGVLAAAAGTVAFLLKR